MTAPNPKKNQATEAKQAGRASSASAPSGSEPESETLELPRLGRDGDPCESCGSELEYDQRYCLSCGHRRGGPRVDFKTELPAAAAAQAAGDAAAAAPAEPASAAAPAAPAAPVARDQRVWTPVAVTACVGLLGVMMLLGVLIGRDQGEPATAAAPAPVIVQSGEEAATTTPATTATDATGKSGTTAKATGAGAKQKAAKPVDTGDAVEVSDETLDALDDCTTTEECAELSKNLPNEVSTGGQPPAPDDKEPGAGTEATVIGG